MKRSARPPRTPDRRLPDDAAAYHAGLAAALRGEGAPSSHAPLGALNIENRDDFSVALLGAWAEVCANLGFYEDLLSAESYLSTAADAASLRDLAALVGYRPQPATAAATVVAFTMRASELAAANGAGVIPAGLAVHSMPVGSEPVQTFEVATDLAVNGHWNELRPASPTLPGRLVVTEATSSVVIAAVRPTPTVGGAVLFIGPAAKGEPPLSNSMVRIIAAVERVARGTAFRLVLQPSSPVRRPAGSAPDPQRSISEPKVVVMATQTRPFGADAERWADATTKQRFAAGTRRGGVAVAMLGVDWDPNDVGTPAVDVLALAADEIGNLYAGTAGRGVYGLRPDEAEWRQLRVGLEKATVTALEVFDEQVFAGTDDERVMSWSPSTQRWDPLGDRVQRTRHGRMRGPNREPIARTPVHSIAAAKAWGSLVLFAGTDRGVFRWMDERRGWRGRSPGLPDWDLDTAKAPTQALAFDRHTIDLFAASRGGVYRSRTLGATWHHRNRDLPRDSSKPPHALDVVVGRFAGHDRTLIAALDSGVHRSTNGGRHWHAVGHFPVDARPVRCVALAGDGELFAGTHRGVMRWNAATDAWDALPAPAPVDDNLLADPMNDVRALAGTPHGVVAAAMPLGDVLELEWPLFWTQFPDMDLVQPKGGLPVDSIVVLRNDDTNDTFVTTVTHTVEVKRSDFGLDRVATRHRLDLAGQRSDDLQARFPIRRTTVYGAGQRADTVVIASDRIHPVRGDSMLAAPVPALPPGGRLLSFTGTPARVAIERLGGLTRLRGAACEADGLDWQDVTMLAVTPNGDLVAQTGGALWLRPATSTVWAHAPFAVPAGDVVAMWFDGDGVVHAASPARIRYRSADTGEWMPAATALPSTGITAACASADGMQFVAAGASVWRRASTDASWEPLAPAPTAVTAMCATGADDLWSVDDGGTVFRRTGGGPWVVQAAFASIDVRSIAALADGSVVVGARPALRLTGEREETVTVLRPRLLFTCPATITAGLEQGLVTAELTRAFDAYVDDPGELGVADWSAGAVTLVDDAEHRFSIVRRGGEADVFALPPPMRLRADPVAGDERSGTAGQTTWRVCGAPGGSSDRLQFTVPDGVAAFVSAGATDAIATEVVRLRDVQPRGDGTVLLRFDRPLSNAYDPATASLNANTVEVTEGITVHAEVIGNGDGQAAGQSFRLAHPHLVHVATDTGSQSTLSIEVVEDVGSRRAVPNFLAAARHIDERVRWTEVPYLGTAGPGDRVFETRTDDQGRTTVTFGDGVHGARLPTGYGNVVATYRRGSGADTPVQIGQLSILPTRPRGVRAVTNPLPSSGGAVSPLDTDMRTGVPAFTSTPSRVIALADYRRFAVAFPGVGDAFVQRIVTSNGAVVHVSVAGVRGEQLSPESPAVEHLRDALLRHHARDVAVEVQPATWLWLAVEASISVDPDFDADDVIVCARDAVVARWSPSMASVDARVSAADVAAVLHAQPGVVGVELHRFTPVSAPSGRDVLVRSLPARFDPSLNACIPAALVAIEGPGDVRLRVGGRR